MRGAARRHRRSSARRCRWPWWSRWRGAATAGGPPRWPAGRRRRRRRPSSAPGLAVDTRLSALWRRRVRMLLLVGPRHAGAVLRPAGRHAAPRRGGSSGWSRALCCSPASARAGRTADPETRVLVALMVAGRPLGPLVARSSRRPRSGRCRCCGRRAVARRRTRRRCSSLRRPAARRRLPRPAGPAARPGSGRR